MPSQAQDLSSHGTARAGELHCHDKLSFHIAGDSKGMCTLISAYDGNDDIEIEMPTGEGSLMLTSDNVAAGKCVNASIADGAVTEDKLGSDAVTTAKISDANVTEAKLADSAVATAKLDDSAVTTAKLNDDAVTAAKIADNVISSDHLAADHLALAREKGLVFQDASGTDNAGKFRILYKDSYLTFQYSSDGTEGEYTDMYQIGNS